MSGVSEPVKEKLRAALEDGTYLMRHEEMHAALKELPEGADAELDGVRVEMAAGLALHHPALYARFFETTLNRPGLPDDAKKRALAPVRYFLFDFARAAVALRLFRLLMQSPGVRDFAIRSFLQTLTEMRVGGQIAPLTADAEIQKQIAGMLRGLSAENWMEADELLDLLEL